LFETVLEYFDDSECRVYTNERKTINRVLGFAEEYPDKVRLLNEPKDNEGYLNAYIPRDWVVIRPKTTRELTEEQRQVLRDRLNSYRKKAETEDE
jgi:hypothetical protein